MIDVCVFDKADEGRNGKEFFPARDAHRLRRGESKVTNGMYYNHCGMTNNGSFKQELYWAPYLLLLLVGVLWIFCLGTYPSFYWDDPFFVFPAYKASIGQPFAYVVSGLAPFSHTLWAYHGPLYPHLLVPLFRLFGYSPALARLPNFLGGWFAPVFLVWFLHRRGYRIAALVLAVLWCGDRANQELLYARMDGMALFFLSLAFFFLVHTLEQRSPGTALTTGICCGLAALSNPVCLLVAFLVLLVLLFLQRTRGGAFFALGMLANLPILFVLWRFRVHDAAQQFLWHARQLERASALQSIKILLVELRWSRFWFLALVLLTVWCIALSAIQLVRGGLPEPGIKTELLVTAVFMLGSLPLLLRSSTHPYYIVYFSVWPMLTLAILVEKRWHQVRVLAVVMALIWCSSAAWNTMRLREALMFHRALGSRFLVDEINRDVPTASGLVTSPRLYSIPIQAGHSNFDLTTWFHENQDVCPSCYVLLQSEELQGANTYISHANLESRRVIYAGPAHPGAGPLDTAVVLFSPEINSSKPQ